MAIAFGGFPEHPASSLVMTIDFLCHRVIGFVEDWNCQLNQPLEYVVLMKGRDFCGSCARSCIHWVSLHEAQVLPQPIVANKAGQ